MTQRTHIYDKIGMLVASLGADDPKNEHKQALITKLAEFGLQVTASDVSELLRIGADTFTMRRGVELTENQLSQLYLILTCLRS